MKVQYIQQERLYLVVLPDSILVMQVLKTCKLEKNIENSNKNDSTRIAGSPGTFSKIPSWLYDKYLLVSVFFVIWMFFFDPKDISSDFNRRQKYSELQKSESHFNQMISITKKELDLLKTNAKTLEKYAREKYMMKKDNEDLFIIDPPVESN